MKRFGILMMLVSILFVPVAYAQQATTEAAKGGETIVKMYYCPMDGYISEKPGKCPLCGMELPEKEMTADEAKQAMEKMEKAKTGG